LIVRSKWTVDKIDNAELEQNWSTLMIAAKWGQRPAPAPVFGMA
jgi:hypothetical protein